MSALTLERIADDWLYIWNAFFRMPGFESDIDVLNPSTVQNKTGNGTYPPKIEFFIYLPKLHTPDWLADGIHPERPCFV